MSEGLAALLGAIIGGGLVVIGDLVARRAEATIAVRRELRDAVAELLSYEWNRRSLAAYRRSHAPDFPESEVWATHDRERRLAASRIAINPTAGDIKRLSDQLIDRTNELISASNDGDEEWELASANYHTAVVDLQARTRQV